MSRSSMSDQSEITTTRGRIATFAVLYNVLNEKLAAGDGPGVRVWAAQLREMELDMGIEMFSTTEALMTWQSPAEHDAARKAVSVEYRVIKTWTKGGRSERGMGYYPTLAEAQQAAAVLAVGDYDLDVKYIVTEVQA